MTSILVIDDEPSILHAFRRAFDAPEYRIATAGDGARGLELAESSRPDVVVSDFDVAFMVIFRDAESYAAYEKDPAHVKMVEEVLKPLTSKVVVYDITNHE